MGTQLGKTISFSPYSSILENQVQSMFLKLVSENEIGNIIQKLKNKTSSGSDGISNKMLKIASSVIVTPISTLINRSFEAATFPPVLKIAKVIPIYKEGDSENFENYRPISSLPQVAKVFERAIYNRILDCVNKFQLLSPSQFGFRQKRRTVDAISGVMFRWKNSCLLCFLRFEESF